VCYILNYPIEIAKISKDEKKGGHYCPVDAEVGSGKD
jgi:hypothetical protein